MPASTCTGSSGELPQPLAAWIPPDTFRARCQFDAETRDTTALLFPLRRLLLALQGYLRARDCSVLSFTLELEHYRQPASEISLGLSAPAREASQFLLLARERLATLTLPAPVRSLTLSARHFTAPSVTQGDFFGSETQRLAQLSLLLDRLRARLGEPSVQGLALYADHRPERAWHCIAPTATTTATTTATSTAARAEGCLSARPCSLLPQPQRIPTPARLLTDAERIESGWWDGDAARDYHVVAGAGGTRLWVFRDLVSGQWYLQGLWS